MKWLKNIENIATKNTPGKCPHCGSLNTDYNAIKLHNEYGNCVIWCNDCKNAFNVSRMKITQDTNTNKLIPKDLKF